ncbi:MAG TPA: hypothetical protein VJQ58_06560 [Burkholderiales bacterium]|nr:hypothetical protein [Burkholderiales bacterium]
MKTVFSLVSAALLLAACGSAPKEESAAAGATVARCDSSGATSCRAGTLYRCEAGAWNSTFRNC